MQELVLSELEGIVARGLSDGLGAYARVPVRLARDRIQYEDMARQPYVPSNPDLHHRNETLTGLSDPQIGLHAGREVGSWTLASRAGVSVPLGRTEPNPFELGRQGRYHQHIQFGTGTWDPILEVATGRPVGVVDLRLTGIARLTFGENKHGYRAGNRYAVLLDAMHWPSESWGLEAGVALAREEAERWDDQVEEEGNLGRTDLFLSLGLTRAASALGTIHFGVQVPMYSHSREEQVEIPLIVNIGWSP